MDNYTLKLFGFIPVKLTWLVSILIDALTAVVDGFVKGEKLSADQKRLTRTLYYLGEEWARPVVDDTETPQDNEVLDGAMDLCKDTAEEGGFLLPTVPEDV